MWRNEYIESVCVYVHIVLLWGRIRIYTVALWGLAFLLGTDRSHNVHFRVKIWFNIRISLQEM